MTKKAFKVLIVDDEPEARLLLSSLLEEIPYVKVVGEACHAEEALYLLVEHYPDLILMDINMPGKSGMELIQLIRKRNMDVPVVFVSAYKEYAVQSIKNGVYDFLLKPIDRKELKDVIDKYRRRNERDLPRRLMEFLENIREDSKIRINSRYSYILVDPSEIVYCQTDGGYTVIYLANGKEEVASATLSQIEEMVKKWNFYKLSRSILINQDYVRRVDRSNDKCLLKSDSNTWEINASHKGIIEFLVNSFQYA
jgi:DNA-binding LytR/AlgR family response regulator